MDWFANCLTENPDACSDNESEATDYSVVDIKVHPGWRPQDDIYGGGEGEGEEEEPSKPFDNDIALLTLDQQVRSFGTLQGSAKRCSPGCVNAAGKANEHYTKPGDGLVAKRCRGYIHLMFQ